jgi:hypothetical protein
MRVRSLYRSKQIEITMIGIRPPRTSNSSMVELNKACVSGVHLPGRVDVLLYIVPERHCGATEPQQGGERKP